MSPLFVDTSALFALADRRDRNHRAAKEHLRRMARTRRSLVTSTYVVDEVLTLVRFRLGHAPAVTIGERLLQTRWVRIVDVGDEVRLAAWQIFVRHADQPFSFTDCTSFALMHAMGMRDAFTFDRRDFAAAGFVPTPTGT